MDDIAYFRSTIEPESAEGPVGWTLSEVLREVLRGAEIDTSPVKRSWDGVKFSCIVQTCHFDVELTPYFEANPMEWSVQVRRKGLRGYIPRIWRPAQESLIKIVARWLTSDERVSLIGWESLAELAAQQRRRTSR